ncbi:MULTISPECIES: putative lipid II flippase FtsW [unclassified Anaerotruncus]|jgi:cell division protein FtsW|uniref:putative lipid II flippase FtsW n=1 Tax=unclassified Anaerotruncus TaxID=2641626 RepID=UPI0003363A2E|nr:MULTISPECIES: putative lipid II flippase FtsW [unclassified Anaerotruncus]EOS61543.1 cell division protein FtsW [Anaerotruncus sp. G3(2012)]
MQYAQSARSAGAPRRKKRVKSKPAERGSMDLIFLILVLTLLGIGLIMLFSASYAYAYYYDGNSFHYITRQLAFAVVGVVALLVVSQIDYHILRRFALLLLGGTLFLLVLVLFYHTQATAKRWIPIVGTFTFQPSELAKFTIVVVFAHLISLNYDRMSDPRYGLWPFLSIMGIIALLMVLQPHLSGTILILSIGVVMMFIGGTNLKWFALGGLFLVGAVVVIIFIPDAVPYAMSRLEHWINPASDPTGAGYQTLQSLYAIGSGGLLGVGIGNSRQKHLYLPEPQNDFVFSVVCEELGFVGATIILLLFVLLVWRGFAIAMRCRDRFGSMLAVGLTTQVGVQTILNIAVVSNTIPNTGISLPFFSYGGTALCMLLAQMGVVLSVSRYSTVEKE